MSCKQRKDKIISILFIAAVYFHMFQVSHLVSLGQWEEVFTADQLQESNATRWERIKQDEDSLQPHQRRSNPPGLAELRPQSAAFPGEPLPYITTPTLDSDGNDSNVDFNRLSWTAGLISQEPGSSAPDSEDGYQADFTGFHGVQGMVMGPSSDSSPHFSEWLAMRPLVQCDDSVMTFTASGEGLAHLLVDREGASPISLFQLPPYCGYSVRTSWSDLEMMVPYDGCYITQENGSYVLPLLWWGSPLKLSCPVQLPTPVPSLSHSAPSVFCSPYGMAVQITGQEQDIQILGVIVNGRWAQFVSEECAYRVPSHPGELAFFISYGAPCITSRDGFHLHYISDDQEYILSCPANPQFPYVPSPPSSPVDPQIPSVPDPAPTSPPPPPPQPPTQGHIAQVPDYPHYPYPGLQHPQLPQVYPPGPQPARPPSPTPGSPPGPQPQQPQGFLYPTGPGKLPSSIEEHQKYPSSPYQPPALLQATSNPDLNSVQESSLHQVPELPVGPSQHASGVYYPYVPFYYPAVTPAPTLATKSTTTNTISPATHPPKPPANPYYSQYYFQMPYYPVPAAAPVTQAPAPLPPSPLSPPPSPPKQPIGPQYIGSSFYPPASHYEWPYPGLEVQPASTSLLTHPGIAPSSSPLPPTTTATTKSVVPKQPDSPSHPIGHVHPQRPIYFSPPTPPLPAKKKAQVIPHETQEPVTPQGACPPYTHTICSHYPHPYYHHYSYYHPLYPPHYPPPYPPMPQYPETQPPLTPTKPSTTTTTTTPATTVSTTTAGPTPQAPYLQCLKGRMVVFLPFAHPDSIQVRDQMKTWLFVSAVSPLCGYMLQMAEGSGVILHSPLPACHSQRRTPTTISLPLRFWDLSIAQYRTLDLQCSYQMTPETPAPVTPSVPPTPPSTTKATTNLPVVPKPRVICSSDQMIVELPSGPVSGIVVKDIKGNKMNLQDAPKHCGYSARKGKDGKIRLSLQLHSRCHMSVQGKMYIIVVIFMTANGRQEGQFSCPVVIPGPGQECNLPSEQRLPCGRGSLSQPQCLSMGCCFIKYPPACYYPMDECTIDRHFVFSVPASLTDPPLNPALLVAAGNSTCKPQRVTSDYALFKIPMDGCGTRRLTAGKTVIYMVEVINKVQAISLNFGTITRDSPVRLLVECRFLPGTVLSVSYLVKTPSLGPEVKTQGMLGVQLRIAKDAQYSSYYPQYHQPLQMLLGKPLYLEVRLLNAPDPSLVLLVHYCVAYPRSGKAVWLLLYNGCPNPLDPALQQAVLSDPRPPSPQAQTRRFTISTFQFLPDGEFKDPNEEIYFMCSTEICSPRDGPCVEGCFGQ